MRMVDVNGELCRSTVKGWTGTGYEKGTLRCHSETKRRNGTLVLGGVVLLLRCANMDASPAQFASHAARSQLICASTIRVHRWPAGWCRAGLLADADDDSARLDSSAILHSVAVELRTARNR
jgi:hypothetical protein